MTLVSDGLRIGFDAKRYFENQTGLGVYSRLLIDTWSQVFPQDELTLFTPQLVSSVGAPAGALGHGLRVVSSRWPFARWLWRSAMPLRQARRFGLDVFHGLSNELPFFSGQPQNALGRPVSLVTVHDVLFRGFPGQYPWFDRQIYGLKTARACRDAQQIVAISQATAGALMDSFGVPSQRISVVHQAAHPNFSKVVSVDDKEKVRKVFGLPREYVLCLGSVVVRKNQLGLLKAYSLLQDSEAVPLVVMGSLSSAYAQEVQSFARKNLQHRQVIFTDSVAFDALPALVQGALFSVYVSLGEGFGLPVTESLLSGTPVLTSSVSSMPEAGAGLAVLADPTDPEALAEGWRTCLSNQETLRASLADGQERLGVFTPQSHVRRMREVYLRCLGSLTD
jgi:glycosyltransferase involved in cell wall biosynthesis